MAKGIALNIGLNKVDPVHYSGWDGALKGCINDANAMKEIGEYQDFLITQLLNEQATRSNVISELKHAATTLSAGDILFISYSGHGGQIPDSNHDEDDFLDETWCLYDAQLIDDELKALLTGFKVGVRILVVSDSCHSGTITKLVKPDNTTIEYSNQTPRTLPYKQAEKVWRKNKSFYKDINVSREKIDIKATVRLLSGCQDNQLSYDGERYGAFTSQLLKVWDSGRFKGNYQQFYKKILMRMPAYQSPKHLLTGSKDAKSFNEDMPFSI